MAQHRVQLVEVGLDDVVGALFADRSHVTPQRFQNVVDVVQNAAICMEGWTCEYFLCHITGFGPDLLRLRMERSRDTLFLWGRKRREKSLVL